MQLYRSEISNHFVELFTKTAGLSEPEFELLISFYQREYVPRKFFYLKAGQVCSHTAYINKGSTRTFAIDEKGASIFCFFLFEDWIIGDLESYHTHHPGKLYIQATEDCELLRISKTDMCNLEAQIPKLLCLE